MSRMVIDDVLWERLQKLLPKPKGIMPVIPSKRSRLNPATHAHHIYKERNIVERFFQKIKRFRRIATRYDKTARMYLTGVMFVSILLALK